ncbi:MAG: hypothetical protein JO193_08885 [Candidatus Eremiobacteraeota bacterium]|nr:hypothetical protein [Candidatus Eremiobacteraeota bacterium]MBV9972284.1 hypothetical protein [Candidatus Eremiobacteraeota bacterium]
MLNLLIEGVKSRRIQTWIYLESGYFTHEPMQWRNLAFLQPSTLGNNLCINIVKPQNSLVSAETYAVYHGRFIEMLVAHFPKEFTNATASARPSWTDLV